MTSPIAHSSLQTGLDSPAPGQSVYDESIFVAGWVHDPNRHSPPVSVRAFLDERLCAETGILFPRPDVAEKLGVARDARIGFRMLGRIAPLVAAPRDAVLRVVGSWDDGSSSSLAEQPVRLVPAALRERPYGDVVSPENTALLHRENIYGSGPPIEEPGVEVSNLLREYLPERASVVDVGCGAGAYGPVLMAAGHAWLGLESNEYCSGILERRQLPFRRVDLGSGKLPCSDGEWDCAICIEVVEHVKDPGAFLSEIARITRGRALFSVPNMEVIPYLYDWRVVPWHLLEADHKNFFTRASLRSLLEKYFRQIEIFSYGEHPLRTRDGVPLHVHLFAVADK
ncbi:MAG TPA: class I SAM-dependent methyltransferase [Chthoniobacterales bacterium]|nr:class I SAM-dependent methyltransferase [Chthoniobacterales bacterium]